MTNLEYVWSKTNVGVGEKCLKNEAGDFIGVETGTLYSQEGYYASDKLKGIVRSVDEKQLNGMIHLDPLEETWKNKYNFIGCKMSFRKAHLYGNLQIYQSFETGEYFNQNELEIL